MLSEQKHANNGRITKGIEVASSVKAVLNFIELYLPEFAQKNKGAISHNENGLTKKLCLLLHRKSAKEPFFFQWEDIENIDKGNSARVDVGVFSEGESIEVLDKVYGEYDAFFKIEAKRLANLGLARQKEYVIGRMENEKYKECGGIERFKKGIHGRDLKFAGIIGYIQKDDFEYWFSEINSWIEDLIKNKSIFWKKEDKLIKVNSKNAKSSLVLKSINYRTKLNSNPDSIHLTHFWIDLR